MIIEGRRGEPKIILKNVPCGLCDFVAENFGELLGHVEIKHPYPLLFSSTNLENNYSELKSKCSVCGKEDHIRHLPEGRHISCYNKVLFEIIQNMKKNENKKLGGEFVRTD